MACHCAYSSSLAYVFGLSQQRYKFTKSNTTIATTFVSSYSKKPQFVVFRAMNDNAASSTTVVSEAVRLLGAPARFEASKLKVVVKNKHDGIIPRTYILSHCDFTANLTLTISHVINLEQLRGWHTKDDVVAEWKKVNGEMCLHVHCFVSGPNLLFELAAELRYQIFSKELPLVLKAVRHGDTLLFTDHPELLDSLVRVYFHSSLQKYNKMECWGPLRDAIKGRQEVRVQRLLLSTRKGDSFPLTNKTGLMNVTRGKENRLSEAVYRLVPSLDGDDEDDNNNSLKGFWMAKSSSIGYLW